MEYTQETPQYLFTYGTLQDTPIQMDLWGHIKEGLRDSLTGYELRSVSIEIDGKNLVYPALFPLPTGSVPVFGKVFSVNEEELLVADEYEGKDYRRIIVTLNSGIDAWVYISNQ